MLNYCLNVVGIGANPEIILICPSAGWAHLLANMEVVAAIDRFHATKGPKFSVCIPEYSIFRFPSIASRFPVYGLDS